MSSPGGPPTAQTIATDGAPDGSLLESLRSYEDARTGIRERFLTPHLGEGRSVAVLSTPLAQPKALGWVICHAFGLEQLNLQSLEVPLARALTAAGFAVLRYHSQGYGDSELPPERISLSSHISDAEGAVRLLRLETGIETVGFVGARLGGAVAALAADRVRDDRVHPAALALWEPVVRGRTYMQALVRLGVMTELVSSGRDSRTARDPELILEEDGILDVQGFPLRREVFEEVSALDLPAALSWFHGRSVVVQISRSTRARPDLQRLHSRLQELGGVAQHQIVTDAKADRFGRPRYKGLANGRKADLQGSMAGALVSRTVGWCTAIAEGENSG